jgi:hypothetical protein
MLAEWSTAHSHRMTSTPTPTARPRALAEVYTDARTGISRTGSLTGVAGAVLYIVGSLLPGSPPNPDAPTSQVVTFFANHRGALLTGFALELIAGGLLLCFLGHLRVLVAAPGGRALPLSTAMAAAWVLLTASVVAGTLPAITLVWHGPPFGDPGLVRMAWGMQILGTYSVGATAAAISIAAPSIVIWRSRLLPRWLSLLGIIEILANTIELAGLGVRHGVLAGGYADGIGALLWSLWVAATSVSMTRLPRDAPEVPDD